MLEYGSGGCARWYHMPVNVKGVLVGSTYRRMEVKGGLGGSQCRRMVLFVCE